MVHLEDAAQRLDRGLQETGPASRSNGSTRRARSCRPSTRRSSPPARRPTSSTCRARSGSNTRRQGGLLDLTPLSRRRGRGEGALRGRLSRATGCSRARTTWCPSTSPRRCCSTTRRCFKEAGIARPPASFDEILAAADKIKGGEDRASDAQLRLAVLAADADERRRPADARPQEGDLQHAEGGRGARPGSPRRRRAARINKISWTGRWVEPNDAFATGNVGMLHAHSPAFFLIKGRGRGSTATRWAPRRCRATGRRPTSMGSASRRARRTPTSPGTS